MWSSVVIAAFIAFPLSAFAGVEVGGTRLIYDGAKKEATLSVKNADKDTTYLIQSWLDSGDENSSVKLPFIITPPLFRLDPTHENQLRVINTGPLAQDRETLYWLSVKSIAATTRETNRLQVAVRTRIKMIYRPAVIKKSAADAYKNLAVSRVANSINFTNPTPHYVSFFDIKVGGEELDQPMMIEPFGEYSIMAPSSAMGKIRWRAINDYGGTTDEASN
jgi:P pilus assembly chaperone PapD